MFLLVIYQKLWHYSHTAIISGCSFPQSGSTLLFFAPQENNVEVVELLLSSGASVELGKTYYFEHENGALCLGVLPR